MSVQQRPTASGWRLTVWTPLMVIFGGGCAAVFLLAAAGHVVLQVRYLASFAVDDAVLTAIIAAPGVAALVVAIGMAVWQRACEVDTAARQVAFTVRWLLGSSRINVASGDVCVRAREYRAHLYRGMLEGHVVVMDAPGVRPIIVARGTPEAMERAARRLAEELGVVVKAEVRR